MKRTQSSISLARMANTVKTSLIKESRRTLNNVFIPLKSNSNRPTLRYEKNNEARNNKQTNFEIKNTNVNRFESKII